MALGVVLLGAALAAADRLDDLLRERGVLARRAVLGDHLAVAADEVPARRELLLLGLGPREESRAANITALEPPPELLASFAGAPAGEPPLLLLAFVNPAGTGDHNSPQHRRAEIPAINGHGSARALARVYGALAHGGELDGVRVLSAAGIERAREVETHEPDALFGVPLRLGLGFWLSQPGVRGFAFGPNEGAFGHPGAGGSLGFADPAARLGFGYVTNRMGQALEVDPRAQALIDALYAC